MQEVMCLEERRLNHPIRTYRRVGDRFAWKMPFDTENVQQSTIPDYVLEYACFQMQSRRLGMHYDYQVFTYEYTDWILKYRYLSNSCMLRFFHENTYQREMDQSAKSVVSASTTGIRKRSHRVRHGWGGSISLDAEFPDWYSEWERQIGDESVFPESREEIEFREEIS